MLVCPKQKLSNWPLGSSSTRWKDAAVSRVGYRKSVPIWNRYLSNQYLPDWKKTHITVPPLGAFFLMLCLPLLDVTCNRIIHSFICWVYIIIERHAKHRWASLLFTLNYVIEHKRYPTLAVSQCGHCGSNNTACWEWSSSMYFINKQ